MILDAIIWLAAFVAITHGLAFAVGMAVCDRAKQWARVPKKKRAIDVEAVE